MYEFHMNDVLYENMSWFHLNKAQKQVKLIYGTGSYANGWCLELNMKVLLESWWCSISWTGVKSQCYTLMDIKLNFKISNKIIRSRVL